MLSFILEQQPGYVDGELIVSADTAVTESARYGWLPADELLLYVIHGTLHLAGYLDGTAGEREKMRGREAVSYTHLPLPTKA